MAKEKKSAESEKFINFLGGLSRGIKNVIGDNAEYAIIHYGAVSCGKELAEKGKYKSIEDFILDNEMLLMHSQPGVSYASDDVSIKFGKCGISGADDPIFYAVVYGLIEGALSQIMGGNFKAAENKCASAPGGGCEFDFSRR